MPIKIPWLSIKQFPLLSQWLDLQIDWAYRLSEKVQRAEVSRGELYPLTRDKTLFALVRAVQPMVFKFKLKDLSNELNVPYDTIRHWAKEERVREKTREYAQQFIDRWFMEDLVSVIQEKERDKSEDLTWSVWDAEELKLWDEAIYYEGLIQEILFDALSLALDTAPSKLKRNLIMVNFVDRLRNSIQIVNPNTTIRGVTRFYRLANKATRKYLELHFDSIETQIAADPKAAFQTVRNLRSNVFAIFDRSHPLKLSHSEVTEPHRKQRKGGTRGGLRDPADERK